MSNEQVLANEFSFLFRLIESFKEDMDRRYAFIPHYLTQKYVALSGLLLAGVYNRDLYNKGHYLQADKYFSAEQFNVRHSLADDEDRGQQGNLLSYLQQYLARLNIVNLPREQQEVVRRARQVVNDALPETHKEKRLSDRHDALRFIAPVNADAPEGVGQAVMQERYRYKSSYIGSTLSSLTTSFLLGGVSRIAIGAALGTVGTPAIASMIAGAAVAGIVTGAYRSYNKNYEANIRQMIEAETTFGGRMHARWRGFRKSYGWKQALLNASVSGAGALAGVGFGDFLAHSGYAQPLKDYFAQKANMVLEMTGPAMPVLREAFNETASGVHRVISASSDFLAQHDIIAGVPDTAPVDVATAANTTIWPEPIKVSSIRITPADHITSRIDAAFGGDTVPVTQATSTQPVTEAYYTARVPKPDFTLVNTPPEIAPADQIVAAATPDAVSGTAATAHVAAAVPANPDIVIVGEHKIRQGDKLWNVARRYYHLTAGDGQERWDAIEKIMAANPQLHGNPNNLVVGENLKMPDLTKTAAAADCTIVRGRATVCTLG